MSAPRNASGNPVRTYGTLLRGPDGAWVIGELEPQVRIRLKQVFPRIQKTAPPPYRFDDTVAMAADLDWFASRYPLAAEPAVLADLRGGRLAFEANQAGVEALFAEGYQPPAFPGLRPGMGLRPYQAQAVEMLARTGGLMVGDEVGLGKTYVAAGACLIPGALPATIVCFPHLQAQWVRVIEAFATLKAHAVTKTRPYALPACDVRVFRYTQLQGWADLFDKLGVGLVAFDEIQDLRKGGDTEKGRAAHELVKVARLRLGLSATPIYNYGSEIWSVMRFLRPEVLGQWDEFSLEWCPRGRLNDAKALGSTLREHHAFLRRTKADVGQDVPPVNRVIDVIDYDAKTLHQVDELAQQLAIRATRGTFSERGDATRELNLRVRHATGVSKAASVAAVARIIVEGGAPIVLVGWHREVYDIWREALADLVPAMYTGSETTSEKAESARRFLAGETDILIMSLRSGAGLDGLQARCSTMVFGELDWSPGVHHQCVGRLDREGQAEPVTAIFLVVEDGSDPPMMEVLGLKAAEASGIMDPHLGVQAVHSDGAGLRRLVERYLTKRGLAAPREVVGPYGETISPAKVATLAELARCGPRGSCAVHGVMEGGTLAALVTHGLARRLPGDALGGLRYGVSDDGWTVLELEGLARRPGSDDASEEGVAA